MYPLFEFNAGIFFLSFITTEMASVKFPNLKLFIAKGNRKIKIHHAYLGFTLAFVSSLIGQVPLLNMGLGTLSSDLFEHIRDFFKKRKERMKKIKLV